MTKQTNTPELRFPEFKNEWSKLTMNDFLMEDKQYGTQKDTNFPIVTSSRQGLYIQNKYFEGDRSFANKNVTFSIVPINYFTYRHMSDDDIFKFNINKFNTPVLVSKEYPVFTVKNTFSQNFIFYELNNNIRFLKFCRIQKKGGTRTRLYFKNLLQYQTYFPNYEEQQKIGVFFYKLDQQIELEEKKLKLLEQQKKGYMQKIFSQELRFKDESENDYPEWKEKKLGDILERGNKDKVNEIGKYRRLTISLHGKGLYEVKQERKTKDTRPFYQRFEGELIIGKQNFFNGSIAIVTSEFNGFICSNAIMSYKISNHMNRKYLLEYLLQNDFLRKNEYLADGTGQKELSEKKFEELEIKLPNSINEQQKIGVFLERLDRLIEKQSNKIELLKQRKKGLLQKMFV